MTPLRSFRALLSAAGGAALALSGPAASAQDLYLGSRTTQVTRTDFLDGASTLVGLCGGQVQSMVEIAGEIFIGDLTGNVYVHDPATGAFGYRFTAANDASALAAEDGQLLVGGIDGSILRYDTSGVIQGTLNAGFPVSGLAVVGQQLLVGSDGGIVLSGDVDAGNFQFWAACGANLNAVTTDGAHLFAADVNSSIWRFDLSNGAFLESYPVPVEGLALAMIEGDLLIGSEDQRLVRVQPVGGLVKSDAQAGFPVDAMVVLDAPEPGQSYCFGTACPCGNDDADNSCRSSAGFGTGLVASGSTSVAADDLVITAYDLPPNKPGRFYMGQIQNSLPFGDGMLCVGAGGYPLFRLQIDFSGPGGILELTGLIAYVQANLGQAAQIQPGSTWHFQAWYRDKFGPCGSTFNTTSAYTVDFTP